MSTMSTPLLLADPHRDVLPHAYVIQVTTAQCLSCGHIGQACETFARTWLKGQWGKPFSNLRPLDGPPKYRLPIERIMRPKLSIPFCDHCLDPDKTVESLPYPPKPMPLKTVVGMTPDTTPTGVGVTKPTGAKKTSKMSASTDDLMKGLDL